MSRFLYSGVKDQSKAAVRRLADARALYEKRRWRGAMYMMGYALECRIKVRLMEKYQANNLEKLEELLKRRYKREIDIKDHRIERLFNLLEIGDKLVGRGSDEKTMRAYRRCNGWNVAWRYRPDEGTENECRLFFSSVEQFPSFVMHNS